MFPATPWSPIAACSLAYRQLLWYDPKNLSCDNPFHDVSIHSKFHWNECPVKIQRRQSWPLSQSVTNILFVISSASRVVHHVKIIPEHSMFLQFVYGSAATACSYLPTRLQWEEWHLLLSHCCGTTWWLLCSANAATTHLQMAAFAEHKNHQVVNLELAGT